VSILELKDLSLIYPTMKKAAVDSINLSIKENEIHALVGESGCGKSSTIRMIAGLENPNDGEIYYRDNLINKPGYSVPPEDREIGMVFQDYALFPHLTVKQNILFGIKDKKDKTSDKVNYFLKLTGLEGLGDRYPHEISGGQMQRVALARALAPEPKLILMDEPFNNLDIRIKRNMLEEVGNILRETGTSCLFITHEKDEAFILADRISVMREGELLQSAEPLELYKYPADTYVAEFFGRANHIPVKVENKVFSSPLGSIKMADHMKDLTLPDSGFLVHRPWDVEIKEDGDFDIEILGSYFFGDYQEVRFKPLHEDVKEHFKFFTHISRNFNKGDRISISIHVERLTFCKD
jgi:iron(III) transport system ATP-binding protein